ncbi:ParB/RepB/Spo0J family partition protein [Pararobbsia silviterrae]|uniref:ParB/RepB/Spo0J family partition protein n=1 Tax=Pararobbsia silviterrae TaxID=1792498 RepID=A0A494XGG8_9BURK|nr:ParB/RepB/Spo0J family partition protein [Pararobbsia silviterrae]RKP49750.1 ParB/RepB/Spo0J family partition protein [Pararobbsia silviterrae]
MTAKTQNRRDLLRASLKAETDSVEKRFAAAEAAMERAPAGLAGAFAGSGRGASTTFSAESEVTAPAEVLAPKSDGRPLVKLPLDRVVDNPFNARQIYNHEVVKERAASIATHGQRVPALACEDWRRPGFYILIDGHYRKRAIQAAGKNEIECLIEPITSDIELYRMSFLLNAERNAQSSLDNALAWQRLLTEKKVDSEEALVELTGLSWGTVNKTLALLKLPANALDKLREHPAKFGVAVGYEVFLFAKSAPEEDVVTLMQRIVDEDLSSRELESLRKKRQAKPARKPKEVSRQYKIRSGNAQVGFIKEWDSGKVAFEVHLPDARERDALVEELKRRFTLSEVDPT